MARVRQDSGQCGGAWALAGDFNTVIDPNERLGANTRQADMDEFLDCIATCGVTDIAATGAYYTWTNKQEPLTRVFSRLNRFMVNQEWMNQFPNMMAHFHPEGLFDHCPCTVGNYEIGGGRRASFKYYNMWGKVDDFIPTVTEQWNKNYPGHKMFAVIKKLKALKPALKALNRSCYPDIVNNTLIAETRLQELQKQLATDIHNTELMQKEFQAAADLKKLSVARDSFLSQKAKSQWLEEGDSNTAYFHGAIKKRINMNKVIQIEDQYGNVCTESQTIQNAFLDYYQTLLGSNKPTEQVRQCVLNEGKFCTQDHALLLNAPVTNAEIKKNLL
ncbi:uncharacterized protein LOC141619376 [Silene latifolia]|uniref:uncharacterized protein LOC141619376 n=1 Tax=Silene latifolia TaxID=37657 RepID=UPI003D7808EF